MTDTLRPLDRPRLAVCVACGQTFPVPMQSGPVPTVCSTECRRLRDRVAHKVRYVPTGERAAA